VWLMGLRGEKPDQSINSKGLNELNISYNLLDDKAATSLCSFLNFDSWLRSLSLRGNNIENKGVDEFVSTLQKNKSILS